MLINGLFFLIYFINNKGSKINGNFCLLKFLSFRAEKNLTQLNQKESLHFFWKKRRRDKTGEKIFLEEKLSCRRIVLLYLNMYIIHTLEDLLLTGYFIFGLNLEKKIFLNNF